MTYKNDLAKNQDEQKIAKMFDQIAPQYDFLNSLLSLQQDKRWRRRLISLIPDKSDGALLDVATGTGDVLMNAAEKRKEYATFVGSDISTEMMSFASKKAVDRGLENALSFKTMSGENLEFEDDSFDCLTISFGLRNIVDKPKAIQEFKRVLKPGGTLLILEFFTPKTGLLGKAFQFYFRRILPTIGGLFSSRDAYTYLPESVDSFYSARELSEVLGQVGFTEEKGVNFLFGATRIVHAKK